MNSKYMHDAGFINCFTDVRHLIEPQCAGQQRCEVPVAKIDADTATMFSNFTWRPSTSVSEVGGGIGDGRLIVQTAVCMGASLNIKLKGAVQMSEVD